jgi:hypothetical protein
MYLLVTSEVNIRGSSPKELVDILSNKGSSEFKTNFEFRTRNIEFRNFCSSPSKFDIYAPFFFAGLKPAASSPGGFRDAPQARSAVL